MKKLVAALSMLVLLSIRAGAQPLYNLPPTGECITNWCEVVRCPAGQMIFTNIEFWPEPPICGLCGIWAWANMGSTCDRGISVIKSAPETTNCPPSYSTNECMYPYSVTNWWEVNGPGGFHDSGPGLWAYFEPTNCGQGRITFHEVWANDNPCGYTNPCPGGSISNSASFTIKCGLQQIVGQGNQLTDVSPTWPSLSFALGDDGQCPFTVSFPGSVSANMEWVENLFCCTNRCGEGIVRLEKTSVNANPQVSLDAVDFNLLSFFPDWLSTVVQLLSPLQGTNNWVAQVESWAHWTLNFSASASANLVVRHNSDGCLGCETPILLNGTATAHVAGSDDLDVELLNIHVHLGGWANGEWKGWIVSIGDGTSADHKTQEHYTWFFYASYIIGPDRDHEQTQGGKYVPPSPSTNRICWSPNF